MRERHGECNPPTKEYKAWSQAIARCLTPNGQNRKSYFKRGIKICDRWRHSYPNFLADMGRAPSKKHTLDRIDNNGNYEPGNCRWATRTEQIRNRTVSLVYEFEGETKTLIEWTKDFNMTYHQLRYRLVRCAMNHNEVFNYFRNFKFRTELKGKHIMNPKWHQ